MTRKLPVPPEGYKDYEPTVEDVIHAIEAHGQEISLTKLQIALGPVAKAHHYKYVDWQKLKIVVEGMYIAGMLIRIREPQGYYRYDVK